MLPDLKVADKDNEMYEDNVEGREIMIKMQKSNQIVDFGVL